MTQFRFLSLSVTNCVKIVQCRHYFICIQLVNQLRTLFFGSTNKLVFPFYFFFYQICSSIFNSEIVVKFWERIPVLRNSKPNFDFQITTQFSTLKWQSNFDTLFLPSVNPIFNIQITLKFWHPVPTSSPNFSLQMTTQFSPVKWH